MKEFIAVSGLPRSGSTLLMNILGQHPEVHVTPTSGCHEVLWALRNNWFNHDEHKADKVAAAPHNLQRVLNAALGSYHDTNKPVVIDKHRAWVRDIEFLEFILGKKAKLLLPVRNLAEVLASYEQLYRKNAHLGHPPVNPSTPQTTRGRVETWAANTGEVGLCYHWVMDAFQRGYGDRLFVVDFNTLTREPAATMKRVWEFLGMQAPAHDFDHVKQITVEDDSFYGYYGMHDIRTKVEPVEDKASQILGRELAASYANFDFWKNLR